MYNSYPRDDALSSYIALLDVSVSKIKCDTKSLIFFLGGGGMIFQGEKKLTKPNLSLSKEGLL